MTSNIPKPRFSAIPALLFAVGLGLVFQYGYLWYRLPRHSTAEIEQSVEINLALDLQKRGAGAAATDAALDQRREAIRNQLITEIDNERGEAQRYVSIGLALLLVSLAQMIILRRMASR